MIRTVKQNRAMHLWLTKLADGLNDAGYDQKVLLSTFKDGFSVPNTMDSMKYLFQTISGTLNGETHTHKLNTKELNYAYEVFSHGIAEKTGVFVDFPREEPPLLEEHKID